MDFDALSSLLATNDPIVRRRLKISKRWQGVLEIEDVMQVTFLEAFLRIDQFNPQDGEAAFGKWLLQIAQNNVRDAIKGLERAKRRPINGRVRSMHAGEDDSFVLEIAASSTSPSGRAAQSEFMGKLEKALLAIPSDYRSVVEHCDLRGKSIAQTATLVGRSPAAVYMLRARAHDRLRELLGTASRFFSDCARAR